MILAVYWTILAAVFGPMLGWVGHQLWGVLKASYQRGESKDEN